MGQISLPQKGISTEEVLNTLKSFKSDDVKGPEDHQPSDCLLSRKSLVS